MKNNFVPGTKLGGQSWKFIRKVISNLVPCENSNWKFVMINTFFDDEKKVAKNNAKNN